MRYLFYMPLLLLAACAGTRQADVTVFHADPARPNDEVVGIVAQDETWQDSLAFRAAQNHLSARLAALGYGRPQTAQPVELVGILSVSQHAVADEYDDRTRIGVGIGGGSGRFGTGVSAGFPVGERSSSANQYALTFALENTNGTRIWEGRAEIRGRYGPLEQVIPSLIDAVLAEFPGPSGVTRQVALPAPD